MANVDSALIWMKKMPTLREQYNLVEYYLANNNVIQAQSILDSMTTHWSFTEQETADHAAYLQLFLFKKSLLLGNLLIDSLDSTKIVELKAIADLPNLSFGRDMARNALCFFYNICYPAQRLATPPSNRQIKPLDRMKKEQGINVYPNPAKDHVVFEMINKTYPCTDCRIHITDLQGRKVYDGALDKLSGMHIWDTRHITPGTYIYELKSNQTVESGKIVILK